MVYQERSLVGALSVAENVYAGRQPVNGIGVIRRGPMHEGAKRILADLEVDIRARELKILEEAIVHHRVVVLPGVHQHGRRQIGAGAKSAQQRRHFHVVRSCADHAEERPRSIAHTSHQGALCRASRVRMNWFAMIR